MLDNNTPPKRVSRWEKPRSGNYGHSNPHGKKTGPKPTFSTEEAVQAALDVGIDRFTLAQVSKRLGVSSPSLYRIARSRAELVDKCIAYIADSTPTTALGSSWQEVLLHFAEEAWKVYEKYPGMDRIVISHPCAYVYFQPHLSAYAEAMQAGNFPGDAEQRAFLLGFVNDITAVTHLGKTASELNDGCMISTEDEFKKFAMKHAERRRFTPVLVESLYESNVDALRRKVNFAIAAMEAQLS